MPASTQGSRTRRILLTALAALLLFSGIAAFRPPRASAALPAQFIAYVNTPNGSDANVWRMPADGSTHTQLTTSGGDEPSISPDGTKIVFTTTRDYVAPPPPPPPPDCCGFPGDPGDPGYPGYPGPMSVGGTEEIYVMNADGTGQTRLTTDSGRDIAPAWSPDGSKIVFQSNRSGNWQIWTMSPTGTNQTRLTNTGTNEGTPRFSPDGSKIVFVSDRSGKGNIWTMNADGTSPVRGTQGNYSNDYPSWSPDGSLIAFTSERTVNGPDTYTITPAGTNETGPLTSTFNQRPHWSPDSTRIITQSPRGGNWDVYSMKLDGTDPIRLTTDAGLDQAPFWGPGVPGVPATAPAAPIEPIATSGNGSASISFSPGSDGGATILKYQVKIGAGSWTDAVGTSSPIVIGSLTNYTSYSIRLRAVNSVGNGAVSAPVTLRPKATGPTLTSATVVTTRSISVNFSAVTISGVKVTGYTAVAYAKGTTTVLASCRAGQAGRACTINYAMARGVEYDVRVKAYFTFTGETTVRDTLESASATVLIAN